MLKERREEIVVVGQEFLNEGVTLALNWLQLLSFFALFHENKFLGSFVC